MDTALKQRLIGAAVLTGLAVVFLPMLFESSKQPESEAADTTLELPTAPQDGFETRELPLAGPAAAPEGGVMGMREAPPQPVKMDEPPASAPAPATQAPNPATAAGDYAVNFGSYASRADADRIVAALAGLQLAASGEPVTVNGKQAWRVYIGPYASRADAEKARIRALTLGNNARATVISRDAVADEAGAAAPRPAVAAPQAGQTPAVPPARTVAEETKPTPAAPPARTAVTETKPVPATPPARTAATETKPAPAAPPARTAAAETKPAPATPPAAPAPKPAASNTGFAVQLGAFANAADAQALRDRARAAGFSAITETVRTDKGTLTRVRLGPVADRAQAERIQAQARSRLGVDGMVRSHP